MAEYIEIHTAVDTREGAQLIARTLVSERLAACVQILGPITSTYWWNGAVEQGVEEWLCAIKSRQELYGQVEQAIRAVHPYETPEITAVDIIAGSSSYLAWIAQETSRETT
jgi:periplasmic divalent cation tolerance protein